jgi:hypothetical protein
MLDKVREEMKRQYILPPIQIIMGGVIEKLREEVKNGKD